VQSLGGGVRQLIGECDEATSTTRGLTTRTLPPYTPLPTLPSPATTANTRFAPPDPLPQTIPGNGAGWAANGSGCVPGVSDYLPDGGWFGFVLGFATSPSGAVAVQFDMGCFYEGQAAISEAAFDSSYTLPNGYYVRNVSPLVFTAPVRADAVVAYLDRAGYHQTAYFTDWPHVFGNEVVPCPGRQCTVWLYVEGGWVTVIQEQETR